MAEFSPIAENFTPANSAEDISWENSLTTPISGYVDTDVSKSFNTDQSNEPYSFPSISGAAVSVEQSLSKISFVQGTSGQMSSAIAYIRYWSRKGTQQKTIVEDNPVNGAVSDPQDALLNEISTLSYSTDLDLRSAVQSNPQPGPALNIPTNTAYQNRPRQPIPTPATATNPSALSRLGSIFSANPGGTIAPAWANPFSSQTAAPSPDNAVWQFLFNPEELQLSSGPDYNRAETWGVSDPANSGQPLSWRSNKNRKLTFSKVLLHGYTFGRRVDSLEKGLQELFQARDGSDGPPVLEFVWGQRVFGPCVIQNIQVREKAWDKGLLVNAEVSFDLEQVPEWTINDEFVDVLRPGRQSTVNDPTVASEGYRDTAVDNGDTGTNIPPPATKPGGGTPYTKDKCKDLVLLRKSANDIEAEISKSISSPLVLKRSGSSPTIFATGTPLYRFRHIGIYLKLLQSSKSELGQEKIRVGVLGNDCDGNGLKLLQSNFKLDQDRAQANNPSDSFQKLDNVDKFYTGKLKTCARNIKSVIDKEVNKSKCTRLGGPGKGKQGPGIF